MAISYASDWANFYLLACVVLADLVNHPQIFFGERSTSAGAGASARRQMSIATANIAASVSVRSQPAESLRASASCSEGALWVRSLDGFGIGVDVDVDGGVHRARGSGGFGDGV